MTSANVGLLGDFRPASVVGQPFADLIGGEAIHALRNRLSWLAGDHSAVHDYDLRWGEVTLDVGAVGNDGTYLIEAELTAEPRLPDAIGMVRSMSDRLTETEPVVMAEKALRQLKGLTGFEHLSLLDRSRNVIASANGGTGIADLFEPATDHSFAKLIADRDAEPVPLVGDTDSPLLSKASFLAPCDQMREQMALADVASAMSLPLFIDSELVATLIASHPTPNRCGAERRSVAHLFAERLVARMARNGWVA
nr:hypothetical protein [uncultured Sphingomonas sp.]